jgi:hypothetical protein
MIPLRFYCQPYCQRRGSEGSAGDRNLLRISKLLIPKSLPGGSKAHRGFDKIAEGDFGRRARVARRARAEGPSQSFPLRHALGEFSSVSFRLLR